MHVGRFLVCTMPLRLRGRSAVEDMDLKPGKPLRVGVGEADFESEVLKSRLPVVVAFWAPWSHPCHILESALDEVAAACAGHAQVVKVNADDNPDLSMWYEIQSIPTCLFFVDGSVRYRVVGTVSKEAVLARLESVIADCGKAPSDGARGT